MKAQRILSAMPEAVNNSGFLKTVLYSFGSFIVAWVIAMLARPELVSIFGGWAWLVPVLNTVAVAIKQYIDALRK